MKVRIRQGQEANAAARLLECLTATGLLSPRITWTEDDKGIILFIKDPMDDDRRVFGSKGQYAILSESV